MSQIGLKEQVHDVVRYGAFTASPGRSARDNQYSGHMLGQDRHCDFFHFPHVGKSNQFEILLQDVCAQRTEVGRIVILHMHEITNVGILRMIVNLSLQREVTARFQVLQTLPEREKGGWAGDRASRNEEQHRTPEDG